MRLEGTAAIAMCDDGLEKECCGDPDSFLFTIGRDKHYQDWTTFTLVPSRLSYI